jgi:hypothetical protein
MQSVKDDFREIRVALDEVRAAVPQAVPEEQLGLF